MTPILYAKTETAFNNNGIGLLTDAVVCVITEERNGSYELALQYPITGVRYKDIAEGCIIKAKANETSELQLFRIYKSSKPINGIVTFNAEHISYDANGIPTMGLTTSGTPAAVLTAAFNNTILPHPFTAWSDISTINNIKLIKPCSLRGILGGQVGSMLDVFGGEYEFDNFTVKLHDQRGTDTDIVIEYGKNLTDINQESNIAECYTHILPYAVISANETDTQGNITNTYDEVISLSEQVIQLLDPSTIGHAKTLNMDFTQMFAEGEEIIEATLRDKTNAYISANNLTAPKINITASFVQLWQTAEYANIAPLERVRLCDTVTVRFIGLGINATAKVIKTVYDSLTEHYNSVELGDAKSNFANTLITQQNIIEQISTAIRTNKALLTAQFQNSIKNATNLITGQNGGYVVLNPAENPQEILIMDTPDINTALKVWRWNSAGLGYSKTGYNGEYALAMTMDGAIVADFITAGELNGNIIKAGSILTDSISQEYKDSVAGQINFAVGEVEQRVETAEGEIALVRTTADDAGAAVSLIVENNKIRGSALIEAINGESTATISADKINLNGVVTANDNVSIGLDGKLTARQAILNEATVHGNISAVSLTISSSAAINAGLTTPDKVVSIIDGTVNADYVNALGITTNQLTVTTPTGLTLFKAMSNYVRLGNFMVEHETNKSYIYIDKISYDDANQGVYLGTDGIGLGQNFYVTNNGFLYAADGRIGGWYIGTSKLYSLGGGVYEVSLNKYISSNTSAFSVTVNGTGVFYVTYNGTVHAEKGTIGGWTLGTKSLKSYSGKTGMLASANSGDIAFYAGNSTPTSAPFRVTNSGVVHAVGGVFDDATVSGTIYADSGTLAGWNLSYNALSHTDSNTYVEVAQTGLFYRLYGDYVRAGKLDMGCPGLETKTDGVGSLVIANQKIKAFNTSGGSGLGYLEGTWRLNGSLISTSDRNFKHDIVDMTEKYSVMFDSLKPSMFKYNDGTSDRLHAGFIAQDVAEALNAANIADKDFAGLVCIHEYNKETKKYKDCLGLRYGEFVSLNTYEIQKLKARVQQLELLLINKEN